MLLPMAFSANVSNASRLTGKTEFTSSEKRKAILIYEAIKNYYINNYKLDCEIKDKVRKRQIVEIRQLSHYFVRKYTKLSYANIGILIGNKNRVTVMHSIKQVNNLKDFDKSFNKRYKELEAYLIAHGYHHSIGKVYICGSISKDLDKGWEYVRNKFQTAENKFSSHQVINPTKLFTDEENQTFTPLQFMSRCIEHLVTCTDIYVLKGYHVSYNACIEVEIAKSLGLNIIYEE